MNFFLLRNKTTDFGFFLVSRPIDKTFHDAWLVNMSMGGRVWKLGLPNQKRGPQTMKSKHKFPSEKKSRESRTFLLSLKIFLFVIFQSFERMTKLDGRSDNRQFCGFIFWLLSHRALFTQNKSEASHTHLLSIKWTLLKS